MKKQAGGPLEKTLSIAVEAHRGQEDKNGGPYILHPLRMMCRVKREGFGDQILKALDCLTKREGEEYEDFIQRSASNSLSRRVKIADLEDNMDIRRLKRVAEKDKERLEKYLSAWRELQGM